MKAPIAIDPVRIPIDRGIPLPRHWKQLYPFDLMKPGDSFLAPPNSRVRAAAHQWTVKNPSQQFTIRKTDKGLRCWRVA